MQERATAGYGFVRVDSWLTMMGDTDRVNRPSFVQRLVRVPRAYVVAIALVAIPASAQTLAPPGNPFAARGTVPERALTIEVTGGLEFAPVVVGAGGGTASVDPRTGETVLAGDVAPLSGYGFRGEVRLTGEPNQPVRIVLPDSIELEGSRGDTITIYAIATTLDAFPVLDANGRLTFSFGGKIRITGDIDGSFRGRIPITANYQ